MKRATRSMPLVPLALLALAPLVGCWETSAPKAPAETPTAASVAISVDFGDGMEPKSFELDFEQGSTLLEAMRRAEGDGSIAVEFDGEGSNARLTSIDGVGDEGGGADARNWQYWINGDYAQVGIGAYVLEPGDKIEWKFTTFDETRESE